MPPFVGNVFCQTEFRGWTETYYPLGSTHAAVMTTMQSIVTNRATISLADVSFVNIRVSDMTIRGDSLNAVPTSPVGTYPTGTNTTVDPDIAYLVRQNGVGSLVRAVRYYRGLPSEVFIFDPIKVGTPTSPWLTAFNGFLAALKTQVQLVQRHPGTPPTFTVTAIDTIVPERATIRRAGRPFGQQPGRRVRA